MSLIDALLAAAGVNTSYYHDEGEHPSEDSEKDVLTAKAVTMVVLCAVSTIMGIVPMFLAKWLKWDMSDQNPRSMRTVGILLGFGGGVLFSTTFLHLIPEVAEGVQNLVESGKMPELKFSLADMLACTGFFIMYLVEESVHTYLRKRQTGRKDSCKKDMNLSTNELVENGQTSQPCASNGHAHAGHSHLPAIMDDDFVITSLRGLLIVLGLSVHELFEGLAIGLESSAGHVWYMFLAVASHKFVIAFCIGVELIASRTRPYLSVIYTCTFAVVSPIGIGIGMGLVGGGSAAASGPMAVILQGLASGTLLYVVFFEILQEHRTGLRQYLSILVGFLVMFGLQMLTAHSHSHGHSHGNHTHMEGHDDDHDHHDDHDHDHEHKHGVVTGAIDKVTDSIAEVLSNALTSSTTTVQSNDVSEISPLRPQRS
ncbi:PREDICTED: zinc transporter ZIP1-like isoform X2 [Wasmannia auropunctata]|uniref:zinc transporter ZIP1-like isoform X2 n=1 Tax=Wasmannia auropunctata TaxID=64793 RepID=UPI0005F06562|nr:PREDICTED: zinc transporter ZIP1-like isoform X2 [Wasmannia auropunctata]XP_011696964.1 PREDICTED: zinc transporter ZIP1-like isoform X2 [Wasmannia auropunctata]XP_011696965.1 PREDICTED: zinc transporter ZIP1-like isoform X2 [Wasmannia auropunctata]XP_011696966.1 PREDICTED: zinc transporter ZIP1-like isoform X2 [Wasmannia auropunctata]XP_011696967.1 PREDICTED: zinc transporter ZIP1-like isoform X2 [Wasmannia auropunctata]